MNKEFIGKTENAVIENGKSESTIELIARSEIDIQIRTAKQYPRSLSHFRELSMQLATIDAETAETCYYVLPRGGKRIEGPSIRLAEIMASAWGNLRIAGRIIGNDGRKITAQSMVHDLETNVAFSMEVDRRIIDKHGKTYSEDMQIVNGNAAISIAVRNAIFKAIPRAYVNQIYQKAKLVAVGDGKTFVSRRDEVFMKFNKNWSVSPKTILDYFGKKTIEDFNAEDLRDLIGFGTAISEGSLSVKNAFKKDVPAMTKPVIKETKSSAPSVVEEKQETLGFEKNKRNKKEKKPLNKVMKKNIGDEKEYSEILIKKLLERGEKVRDEVIKTLIKDGDLSEGEGLEDLDNFVAKGLLESINGWIEDMASRAAF